MPSPTDSTAKHPTNAPHMTPNAGPPTPTMLLQGQEKGTSRQLAGLFKTEAHASDKSHLFQKVSLIRLNKGLQSCAM